MHTALRLDVGGLERFIAEVTVRTDPQLFNVEVCCFHGLGQFADVLIAKGIPISFVEKTTNISYLWKLRQFFKEKNVDIIHAHTGSFFYAAVAGRLAGVPVIVYTEHGRFSVDPLVRIVEDFLAVQVTDKVIAVSDQLKTRLIEQVGFPRRKVLTVINGINTDQFTPRPRSEILAKSFGVSANHRVIGTVGRLDDVKDQLTLIKAFEIVNAKLPQTVLMLVGDGPLRGFLQDYVNHNNLVDRVIFAGNRKDIPDILNLFDIFVLSSLSEGTSLSLLEAMASGLPAVVTDVGGNPSIVTHNVNGLLVKPRATEQMADAIVELLTDGERYIRMSHNASQRIKADFSIDCMMEKYNEIYFELLNRKRVI